MNISLYKTMKQLNVTYCIVLLACDLDINVITCIDYFEVNILYYMSSF